MQETVNAEFAGFVAARQHRLLRAAYLVCGNEQLAQDLVQQALVKLAMRWERLRDGNPDAYVQRILYRDAISWWRRFHRERPGSVPDRPVEGGARAADTRIDVRRAMRRLPPRQRAVLVLRYFEDLTESEIAEVLGVSMGTVKSQAHAGLQRLREVAPELTDSPGGKETP